MPSRNPQPILGRRLKALRVSRGLSLKQVGDETGLSTSFLSMVEAGRHELTVGRLVGLLDFYEVDLADVIPDREMEQPVVLRLAEREAVAADAPGVRIEPLAAWHYGEASTASMRFAPGAELSVAASPAGPEFVLVLAGELKIDFPDDTTVQLGEGDSASFEGSRLHRCVNVGEREAHVITFKNRDLEPNVPVRQRQREGSA
jgi:transcriptional regulator with XRE-family HTH domain